MVEIGDEASLLAWLEGDGRNKEDCVGIAARSALRSFPAVAGEGQLTRDQLILPILRANLVSVVSYSRRSHEIEGAADSALLAADAAVKIFAAANPNLTTDHTFIDSAAASANSARSALTATLNPADSAATPAARSAGQSASSAGYSARETLWNVDQPARVGITLSYSAISKDAKTLERQKTDKSVFHQSLWPRGGIPDFYARAWKALLTYWDVEPATWNFWQRWYAGMIDGAPLDWELQRDVALIPNEIWAEGPKAVAAAIAEIEARSIANTLRETVEISPAGRLTLIPQPFKETRHLGQLLAIVRDTLDLATGNLQNGLSRDCYQAQRLNLTMARYGNDPQRIEMDFEMVKASLLQEMAEDVLPSSPANRDLVQSLADAAGSIRDSDPEIAASRERLNRIRLKEISPESATQIAHVAEQVAGISEDALKDDLLEDRLRLPGIRRDDLRDPVVPLGGAERNATLESQAAQLRLYSRLTKIWLVLKPKNRVEFVAEVSALASVISVIVGLVAL